MKDFYNLCDFDICELLSNVVLFEMSDDRPIKPDKKYLEQYIERISQV